MAGAVPLTDTPTPSPTIIPQPTSEPKATSEPRAVSGLIIDKIEKIPTGNAGEKVKIKIPIRNLGAEVKNVVVFPVQNVEGYPFTRKRTNEYAEYGTIKQGKTVTKTMEFTVRKDVLSGEYPLKFRIYYDGASKEEDLDREIVINIKGAKPTATPKPDERDDDRNSDGENDSNDPSDYGDDDNDDDGGSSSSDGSSYNSGDDEEKKTGTPRVIIESFRTEPKIVNAGSSFKLILEIRNTSKKTAVNNMEITLQSEGEGDSFGDDAGGSATASDTFLPDKGSNSLYIDSIAIDSTKEVSIDLTARADLQQQPYSVGIAMRYEDSKAEQYDASSAISIPVHQEARFELSKVEVAPDIIEIGSEGNVVFSIYNLGRTRLYNVKAALVDETIGEGEIFIGNLDPGATGDVDLMVMGVAETTDDGTVKIRITYEDKDGNISNYEDTCTIFVAPMVEQGEVYLDEDMEMIEDGAGGGLALGIPSIIGIVVGVVAVVAVAVGIIKYKRKKEEDFADEFLGSDKDERK